MGYGLSLIRGSSGHFRVRQLPLLLQRSVGFPILLKHLFGCFVLRYTVLEDGFFCFQLPAQGFDFLQLLAEFRFHRSQVLLRVVIALPVGDRIRFAEKPFDRKLRPAARRNVLLGQQGLHAIEPRA